MKVECKRNRVLVIAENAPDELYLTYIAGFVDDDCKTMELQSVRDECGMKCLALAIGQQQHKREVRA